MNRSEMFMLLLGKKPWTDYEWAKRTGITRATFGNNRKNNGENIKANTLEAMAKACGQELRQDASDQAIKPNSKDALFSLTEVNNDMQRLKDEIKRLKEENEMLRRLVSSNNHN
jgi:tRNA(Phe) wybutosine-synthesizing methylase Tyw3